MGAFSFSWVVNCSLSSLWSFNPSGISFLGSTPNTASYGTLFIALCKVMFFLYAASPRTAHHFPRLSECLECFLLLFDYFFPPVLELKAFEVPHGPCFLHSSLIVLLLNSFPLSECSIDGKPNSQNKLASVTATSSVCFLFKANIHEYLLKWSTMWSAQLCLDWHSQGKLRKSMRSTCTCARNWFALIGFVIGFFQWFVTPFCCWCNLQSETNKLMISWEIPA